MGHTLPAARVKQRQAKPVPLPVLRPRRTRSNAAPGGTTASVQVYQQLRSRIMALDIPPGAALSENDLASAFGVSRTPVREALLRLADEGLVEIVPKSGTTVSRIPYAQLAEAIVIRRALEEVAVRMAAERGTKSQFSTLRALLERQREAAIADDHEAFHRADEAFHAAIAETAGYPGIWQLVKQVKVQVDRYRRLTLPEAGRMMRVVKEHAAVLVGMEKRDEKRAVSAIRSHLAGLENSLPEIRRRNPDLFVDEAGVFVLPGASGRKTRSA